MFQSKYGSTGIVDKPFRPGKQEVSSCSTWRGGRCRCIAWPGQCVFDGLLSQWHGQGKGEGCWQRGSSLLPPPAPPTKPNKRSLESLNALPAPCPCPQVTLSAFAYLFSELVQYCQSRVSNISELERR